jgi:competence protein ComGC
MNKKGFTIIEAIVVLIIGISLLFVLCLISFGIKGCSEINHHGLKGTVNHIWNGPDTNQIKRN